MFRFIHIASLQDLEEFDWLRLRIYDFFYLFPHLVSEIQFPRVKGKAALIKDFSKLPSPYESLPDKKRLFSEMGDYHIQALQILKAKGVFKEVGGKLRLDESFHSQQVHKLIENNSNGSEQLFCRLFQVLNGIELVGDKGLKQRTGLMEFRYDAV